MAHFRPTRLRSDESTAPLDTHLQDLPALEPVNWASARLQAPELLDTTGELPEADIVILTWAGAEWAALEHVFCASGQSMPYSDHDPAPFPGWQKDSHSLPAGPSDWTFWGYFRLVGVGGKTVLLYKSNTHLDWPGETILSALVDRLVAQVRPKLVLSLGTAGGANATDHIGTVPVVHTATLYDKGAGTGTWPLYTSPWRVPAGVLSQSGFKEELLVPVPTSEAGRQALCQQLNATKGTSYSIEQLDPLGLNLADPVPAVVDHTANDMPLLTATSFLVGTTNGTYAAYACIEMDDAIVARQCTAAKVDFGAVRNVSDPAQDPKLHPSVQADWGSAVYDAYGLYTSVNGALVTAAILS